MVSHTTAPLHARTLASALVVALVAFGAGFIGPQPQRANAHSPFTYFTTHWPNATSIRYNIGNDSTLDRNGLRDALTYGSNRWNVIADSTAHMSVLRDTTSVGYHDLDGCPSNYSGIWVFGRNIDGNPAGGSLLAQVGRCRIGTEIVLVRMSFDTSHTWSYGSATPSSGTLDMRGIATHEFGHALGFENHWAKPSTLCSDQPSSSDHTMCPTIRAVMTHWRTLATHDVHTTAQAY